MISPLTLSPTGPGFLGGFSQPSVPGGTDFGGGIPASPLNSVVPPGFGSGFAFPQLEFGAGFPQNGNFAGPQLDATSFSPEASQPDAQMNGFLSALNQAYGPQSGGLPTLQPDQMQQQIAQLQQQMVAAQQSGDDQSLAAIMPQLESLLAQLVQMMGGQSGADMSGGDSGTSPASDGGLGSIGSAAPSSSGGGGGGGFAPSSGGGGGTPSAGTGGSAAPSSGGGGSSAPAASGGSSSSAGASSASSEISKVPPKLAGDDKALAKFIDGQLKGTPLDGHGLGAQFVKAGREEKVDPLALVAISRHETNFGSLGVGVAKHMGVGAYDSSPSAPRQWDGALNQIYSGAKTFNHLRENGGSNPKAPMDQQLAAVNKAGWATDQGWHTKVGTYYNEIANDAAKSVKPSKPAKAAQPPKPAKPPASPAPTKTAKTPITV